MSDELLWAPKLESSGRVTWGESTWARTRDIKSRAKVSTFTYFLWFRNAI
jgi:hypothetical protein